MVWGKCIICQGRPGEKTECPAKKFIATRRNLGYKVVACNLQKLRDADFTFPSKLTVLCLDDGGGLEATLQAREALWHKDCMLPYRQGPKFNRLLADALTRSSSMTPNRSALIRYIPSQMFAAPGHAGALPARDFKAMFAFCHQEDKLELLTKASTTKISPKRGGGCKENRR
jgi:hypothetical protein